MRDELYRYGKTAARVGAGLVATSVALGSCGEGVALSYGYACCCMDGGSSSACGDPGGNGDKDALPPPDLLGETGATDASTDEGRSDDARGTADAAVDAVVDGTADGSLE